MSSKPVSKLLIEFAKHMRSEDWDNGEVRVTVFREWDSAYPDGYIGDDLLIDIDRFLYAIGDFVRTKVFGNENYSVYIMTSPSYNDVSSILLYERESLTVVARDQFKTWHLCPESLEETLKGMIKQAEEAKNRIATLKLLFDVPTR